MPLYPMPLIQWHFLLITCLYILFFIGATNLHTAHIVLSYLCYFMLALFLFYFVLSPLFHNCCTAISFGINKASWILNGLAWKYISGMLEPYEPTLTLRTSGRGLLLVPRVRTKQGEAVFQFYAPEVWNSLPEDVRQASTLTMFKSRLKTVLFSCAYDNWKYFICTLRF